ncbi:MAG: RNase adapter RapZ [Clostridia bacterium]|nr:RNase adapter RapZ [Clostridia bacterium]
MRCLILTGMSGAGKTSVLRYLEDSGFLCVDNLPPMMIAKFLELCGQASTRIKQVALAVDIRSGEFFDAKSVRVVIEDARRSGHPIETLYLDAVDDELISRYKETRRDHPLAGEETTLTEAIAKEREMLQPLREFATFLVDTSHMRPRQTAMAVGKLLDRDPGDVRAMRIEILSFGFKRGLPRSSDLVYDVRFLPNPFYIQEIRLFTGLEEPVRNFVLGHPATQEFLQRTYDMLAFLLPHYREEGKQRLMISVGCTGGAHRSVAISEELARHLASLGLQVDVNHRDIEIEKGLWQSNSET